MSYEPSEEAWAEAGILAQARSIDELRRLVPLIPDELVRETLYLTAVAAYALAEEVYGREHGEEAA